MGVRATKTCTFERERVILGEDFDDFLHFFVELLSYCAKPKGNDQFLVAFVTRRCHILLQLFLNIFDSFVDGTCADPLPPYLQDVDLSRLKEIVDRHFLTDFNLVVQAGRIADHYKETGSFPEVVILDEIIIHGRAVNNLLLTYEAAVIGRLKQLEPEMSDRRRAALLDRLASATKLYIYAQNNEPLLLLPRYQRQLCSKHLYSPRKIKELSQKFASLVISGNVNNVAYSWNFKLQSPAVERWASLSPSPDFVTLTTNLRYVRQDCCLWLYPNASSPKAICSIRWKQHHAANCSKSELLVVPFIVFDRIPRQNLLRLHNRICEDLEALNIIFLTDYDAYDIGSSESCYLRWLSETNDLVLTYLLFRRFCGANGSCEAWSRFLETSILARNYKLFPLNKPVKQSSIVKELRSIWSWVPSEPNQLEQYFDILLEGAQPIWSKEDCWSNCGGDAQMTADQELIRAVEDTIAFIGYEAEKTVCEKYSSGVFLSDETLADWGAQYSLSQVLDLCRQFWSKKSDGRPVDVYAVLALLVQEMDLGIIGMSPQLDRDTDTLFTMVRAGEHSLFITPTRYQPYIPALIRINQRCCEGHLDLYTELVRFIQQISYYPRLDVTADDLYAFIRGLESVNQDIEDWDFQLLTLVDFQNESQRSEMVQKILQIKFDQYYFLREYRKI